jgi:hypothetical protein
MTSGAPSAEEEVKAAYPAWDASLNRMLVGGAVLNGLIK